MLTLSDKIYRLQDCIALLQDVDVKQQSALGERLAMSNSQRIQSIINGFEADISDLAELECLP